MLFHDRHDICLVTVSIQLEYVRINIDNLDGMNNGEWRNVGIVFMFGMLGIISNV